MALRAARRSSRVGPAPPGGFTLVEALAVLLIVVVLAGLAVPGLRDALARHRLRATVDALEGSLRAGRAAAILQRRDVDVCPSFDGRTCALMEDWSLGWIGRDRGGDGGDARGGGGDGADGGKGDVPGKVFDRFQPLDEAIAAARGRFRGKIRFRRGGTSPGNNQRITLCLRGKPVTALTLVVSNAGRVSRQASEAAEAAACANAGKKIR